VHAMIFKLAEATEKTWRSLVGWVIGWPSARTRANMPGPKTSLVLRVTVGRLRGALYY
jgi:hypothetical protein